MPDRDKVLDQFFGDASTPIEWAGEDEKKLHFWLDDLHCPQPISPMWFDIGGWWLTCGYMYRRFGVPFGKDWVAKTVNGYLMSAVVPRPADEEAGLWAYYNMVMPVYADKFLDWWKRRYLPEILRNFEYLDTFPMDTASLPELMILLEEAIDIQERHWRLHWMLNLAQFQASITFESILIPLIGDVHKPLVGRILISDEDRNWDSVRELWTLKEKVKKSPTLRRAFDENETADGVLRALATSEEGRNLLKDVDKYKNEYGNKSMYAHEYIYTTWRENPTPIIEALRGYLLSDYDCEKDVRQLRENREAAIEEMWSLVPPATSQEDKDKLKTALDLALKMTPLTPDHHFYMDQGTYARMRLVLMGVGRKLVELGGIDQADDIMFLKYDELRAAQRESHDVRRAIDRQRTAPGARGRIRGQTQAVGRDDYRLVDVRRALQTGTLGLAGHLRALQELGGAAIGNSQGARCVRRCLRRPGARRRVGRAIRPGEERRRARLQDDESIMGGALHEDRRARHRLGRRPFSSGSGIARVRDSSRRRYTNGNASHQNRSARAAERSVWSC